MTIPIKNLYYLFCYAWGRFPGGGSTEVGIEACPDLPNLFAKVLIDGVNRLARRGLDRGYTELVEETRSPKGRLFIDQTIKEQTLLRGRLICQVDDLQRDVLHNQILKATAVSLIREERLEPPLSRKLRVITSKLGDISDIRLTADVFKRVQLFQNNKQYGFLMQLCKFVFHSALPTTRGSGWQFSDILKDEMRMSQIFENFLKNFYFREQDTFAVASENLHWDVTSPSISDLTMIPIMKTDVTLRNRSKIIIIDAKFYSEPFAQSFGIQKLRSSHLYQLYAYLKQTAKDTPSASVQGMLMYAANSAGSRKHYEIDGHSITIVTLDLNRPWPLIHCELLDLIVGDTTATVARL